MWVFAARCRKCEIVSCLELAVYHFYHKKTGVLERAHKTGSVMVRVWVIKFIICQTSNYITCSFH